ncbi:glycine cleavage system protein GcvH [Serinibacter salmoneus]|uniref:Glycine cleavage system H protein n=1 Tax=Serinibacter salmoneus TaxID=556530 RepID=A0A2A9CZU8_9MICO|nr:glycine cleavage system protein GcvH [Serinibacter salmoneus]PFG19525.1 glycine cleavage system H protein [Serinibacter salmoneus]
MTTSDIPQDLQYTSDHEWVALAADVATVGITAYAAGELGDVVFVALPEVGADLRQGEVCGEVESHKSVSEVFAPVTGEVTEVNTTLQDEPGSVSEDPYGAGWLFRVRVAQTPELMAPQAYGALLEGL